MPCQYCEICEKLIDLDEDVEHFDEHLMDECGEVEGRRFPQEVENPQPVKSMLKVDQLDRHTDLLNL